VAAPDLGIRKTALPLEVAAPTFKWLDPLGTGSASPSFFDAAADPIVEICAWPDKAEQGRVARCANAPIARFSLRPSRRDLPLTVDITSGFYEAEWPISAPDFTTRRTYRIKVLRGSSEIGAALVDVERGKWGVSQNGEVALHSSSVLPIRFWVGVARTFQVVEQLTASDYTLHVNRGDPILATIPAGNGEVLQYISNRGAGTGPLELIGVQRLNLDTPTRADRLTIGENGLPAKVVLRDGSQVTFAFESDTRVHMTFYAADGQSQSATFEIAARAMASRSTSRARPASVTSPASSRTAGPLVRQTLVSAPIGGVPVTVRAFGTTLEGITSPIDDALVTLSWSERSQTANAATVIVPWVGPGLYARPIQTEPTTLSDAILEEVLDGCLPGDFAVQTYCAALEATGFFDRWEEECGRLERFGDRAACLLMVAFMQAICNALDFCAQMRALYDSYLRGGEVLASVRFAHQCAMNTAQSVMTPPYGPQDFTFRVTFQPALTVAPTASSVEVGSSTPLSASLLNNCGFPVLNPAVTWVPLDPNLVSVIGSGPSVRIRGDREGQARVLVRAGELEKIATITVRDRPVDPVPGNNGSSSGDPHLRTADGLAYDFQAVGDYVLSKATDSDDFQVQIRQRRWEVGSNVSVNDAVAVAVAGDVVNIFPTGRRFDLIINNEVVSSAGELSRQLSGGGTIRVSDGEAKVSWPDRSLLSVSTGALSTISVQLLLAPSRVGKVEGLFGNNDGDPANDLRIRNGPLMSLDYRELYKEYRDSWHVALGSSESLFRRGPDLWDPGFPGRAVTLNDLDPAAVENARSICRAAGVATSDVLDGCALDIVVTGENGWAADAAKIDPATPTVTVTPALSYMAAGDSRPFAAAVSGLTNRAVNWTATGGSVLATGENNMTYTAPTTPDTYTITARSVQNSSIIATATVVVSLVCVNPQPGLVSWWPGDGNASDIVAGNHGAPQNGTTFVSGKVGQAFSFDGLNDYVSIPDNPTLTPPSNSVTLDAWIKPNTVSGPRAIVTKYSPPLDVSWDLIVLDGGRIRFDVYQSGAADIGRGYDTVNPVISAGVWQHVAATFDVATQAVRIYVDGVEVPAILSFGQGQPPVTSIRDSNSPVRIGALQDGNSNITYFWNGLIDEVDLFDRALTSAEIQAIFAGSARKCAGAFNQSPSRRS
jgi:hypothetical protein